MSRLLPMPVATLARRLKFCWAASRSLAVSADASAFICIILTAAACCSWPTCAATKAAAMEAIILETRTLVSGRDLHTGDAVDLGAVGHVQDVVLGVEIGAVRHDDDVLRIVVLEARRGIDLFAARQRHDVVGGVEGRAIF